jgi:hypothetical protein
MRKAEAPSWSACPDNAGFPQVNLRPSRTLSRLELNTYSEHIARSLRYKRLIFSAVYVAEIFLVYPQDDQKMHDLRALALSASQTQARILNCDQLFSKHRNGHLLEVTRFTHDASCAPSVHSFTSSLQLSAYFNNDASNMGVQGSSLEIW